jgi:hypothetical protein
MASCAAKACCRQSDALCPGQQQPGSSRTPRSSISCGAASHSAFMAATAFSRREHMQRCSWCSSTCSCVCAASHQSSTQTCSANHDKAGTWHLASAASRAGAASCFICWESMLLQMLAGAVGPSATSTARGAGICNDSSSHSATTASRCLLLALQVCRVDGSLPHSSNRFKYTDSSLLARVCGANAPTVARQVLRVRQYVFCVLSCAQELTMLGSVPGIC